MKTTKKVLSLVLALLMLISVVSMMASGANAYVVNGVTVTADDFSSTSQECWDYANKLYRKIWGSNFSSLFDDENNCLRNLSDDQLLLNEDNLRNFISFAPLGACLRVSSAINLHSHDGWVNNEIYPGHNQIIVQKDTNGFTCLEGGLTDYPHKREKYYTWSEYCNTNWLGGRYEYIKYIKWPGASAYTGTPNTKPLVKYTYPSHCNIKISETGKTVKSLPCSNSSDSNSIDVESAPKGTTYEAIELIENRYGNLWYKVKAKNGKTGYVFAGNTTYVSQISSGITYSGITVPTNHTQGKSYVLTGKVTSSYCDLTSVSVYIYSGSNTSGTAETGASATVSGRSYSFGGSTIDNNTKFNVLSTGTHTMVVKASYKNVYATADKTYKTVTGTKTLYTATFNVVSSSHSHSYTSTITTQPTCINTGVRIYKCSCGASYTETIAKTSHDSNTTIPAVAATCTKTGLTEGKKCSVCGTVTIAQQTVAKKAHNYASSITTQPTCTNTGVRSYKCSCGASYTEKINATGHSWTALNTCSKCNITCCLEYGEHDYQENKICYVSPTCTKDGVHVYNCLRCGDDYTVIIPAYGHNYYSTVKTPATCTTDGIKSYTCEVFTCRYNYTETITATGHKYDNACDGTCNNCDAKRTVNHDYKAATCTAPKTCKVCKATTGSVSAHKYTTTVTKKATTSKNGKTTTKCTSCGKSTSDTVYYIKTIKLSATSYTYNGKTKTPSVTVKDSKGKTLKKNTDYTVKYASGRKSTGKYAVKITFKGKYSGTKTLYFNILPSQTSKITPTCATTSIKATWSKVTGASGYKVELLNSKGKVVKSVTTTKTTYTFKKLSKVTTYKIRVTAYKTIDKKAVYSTVSTTITTSTAPAAVTLSKVTAGSKSATPTWKTVSGASGYQVMYSTSSKFSSSKTANVSKGSSTKTTIKSLTKGKTYYFKVRAYKTVDGNKVYGAWSAVKSVKVK